MAVAHDPSSRGRTARPNPPPRVAGWAARTGHDWVEHRLLRADFFNVYAGGEACRHGMARLVADVGSKIMQHEGLKKPIGTHDVCNKHQFAAALLDIVREKLPGTYTPALITEQVSWIIRKRPDLQGHGSDATLPLGKYCHAIMDEIRRNKTVDERNKAKELLTILALRFGKLCPDGRVSYKDVSPLVKHLGLPNKPEITQAELFQALNRSEVFRAAAFHPDEGWADYAEKAMRLVYDVKYARPLQPMFKPADVARAILDYVPKGKIRNSKKAEYVQTLKLHSRATNADSSDEGPHELPPSAGTVATGRAGGKVSEGEELFIPTPTLRRMKLKAPNVKAKPTPSWLSRRSSVLKVLELSGGRETHTKVYNLKNSKAAIRRAAAMAETINGANAAKAQANRRRSSRTPETAVRYVVPESRSASDSGVVRSKSSKSPKVKAREIKSTASSHHSGSAVHSKSPAATPAAIKTTPAKAARKPPAVRTPPARVTTRPVRSGKKPRAESAEQQTHEDDGQPEPMEVQQSSPARASSPSKNIFQRTPFGRFAAKGDSPVSVRQSVRERTPARRIQEGVEQAKKAHKRISDPSRFRSETPENSATDAADSINNKRKHQSDTDGEFRPPTHVKDVILPERIREPREPADARPSKRHKPNKQAKGKAAVATTPKRLMPKIKHTPLSNDALPDQDEAAMLLMQLAGAAAEFEASPSVHPRQIASTTPRAFTSPRPAQASLPLNIPSSSSPPMGFARPSSLVVIPTAMRSLAGHYPVSPPNNTVRVATANVYQGLFEFQNPKPASSVAYPSHLVPTMMAARPVAPPASTPTPMQM